MTSGKRKAYIVKVTNGDSVYYVTASVGLTLDRAGAALYTSKRDAQRMGKHLCGVAAYRGDASWTSDVEVEP